MEGTPALDPKAGLALSVASVSTAAVLIRLSSADPLPVAAFRLLFAVLVLVPFALLKRRDLTRISGREALALLGIGSCLAAHFGLWIASLYDTTVAASVLLVSTSPVFVALFGRSIAGEGTGGWEAVGIVVALAGAAVVFLPGGRVSGDMRGATMALLGAMAVAGYILGGRRLRRRLSLVSYAFWVYTIAALELTVLCVLSGSQMLGLPARDYGLFLALGIVPSHMGHTLYNYLLRYLRANVIAVSTLGEPVFSSALAFLVLGEVPRWTIMVGAPLVLAGVYLTMLGSGRHLDIR